MAGVPTPIDGYSKMTPNTSERLMPHRFPVTGLSEEEWILLISATAAYQHNAKYQDLHIKLLTQQFLAQSLMRMPMA